MSLTRKELLKLLKQDLKDRFFYKFQHEGFHKVPLYRDNEKCRKDVFFPLGQLVRHRGDDVEAITIQFDKYHAPKFRISFGLLSADDQFIGGKAKDISETNNIAAGNVHYDLYNSPHRLRWFGLGVLQQKTEKSVSKLITRSIGLSDEVLDWFDNRNLGKHVREVDVRSMIKKPNT